MHLIEVVDAEKGIRDIRFNRPEKLNAINPPMRSQLAAALAEAIADTQVRVIILSGAGRAFSAGNDFDGYAADSISVDQKQLDDVVENYLELWNSHKPVIAQVHGHCLGMSTLLGICADLVFVADDTRIGWPILPIGGGMISPAWAWLVGPHKAKEFSYQPGYTLSGTEAAELGWANQAVPADELRERVLEVAREVRRVPTEVMRLKKQAINRIYDAQGFQSALRDGAAWDAIAHTDPATHELRQRISESGIKGARAWYMEQTAL